MATAAPELLPFELPIDGSYTFYGSLHIHRLGAGDPTVRLTRDSIVKALSTPEGPVTLAGRWLRDAARIVVQLAGPGARWMRPHVEAFFGLHDRHIPEPADGPARALWLRGRGLRLARTPILFERHMGFILEQRVTFDAAARAWRGVHLRHARPAPEDASLRVPLDADQWRRVTAAELGRWDVDLKRWTALQEAARAAPHLVAAGLDLARVRVVLDAIRGTGVWTRECVVGFGGGDADALPLGDVHLAPMVTMHFEGRPQASDARMVELLEPFRPDRFRIVRWLMAPRYG